jgi:hypothetical protein
MYWTYSLVSKIEYHDRTLVDCRDTDSDPTNDVYQQAQCPEVPDIADALSLPRNVDESPTLEVGVLFAMLLFYRYVIYLVLCRKTRKA